MREIEKEVRREGERRQMEEEKREGSCWATSSEHLDPAIPESCLFMEFPVA